MPQPQLFIDLEKLYEDCYDRIKNFPKLDKHLLGKEILNFINEAHKCALLAIFSGSYLPLTSANFDLTKKSLRIALNKKLISQCWYAEHLELISSIGKEIGGWIKKSKTPRF